MISLISMKSPKRMKQLIVRNVEEAVVRAEAEGGPPWPVG